MEVGCEELPVAFAASAPAQWQSALEAEFEAAGLSWSSLRCDVTPRRLWLQVEGLPEATPGGTETTIGPPLHIAKDADGNFTKAGEGFAKKMGVSVDALEETESNGTRYLQAVRRFSGEPANALLARLIPESILALQGSYFMRWGDSPKKFSRPIRWLVALWNDKPLPLAINNEAQGLMAGTQSRGNRLAGNPVLSIPKMAAYLPTLESQGKVVAETEARRQLIVSQLQKLAADAGATIALEGDDAEAHANRELLDTVVHLVEWPSVIKGSFEDKYLELPEVVIRTLMASHQKYFALRDAKTGTLLPNYAVVSNHPRALQDETLRETILEGNARVLRARLEDALFFWRDDRKRPLESRLDDLRTLTFQRRLGTMADKVSRLEALTADLAAAWQNGDNRLATVASRAARLAKCDLTTAMVFELTELQGDMGAAYARAEGEDEAVAMAIAEHYKPRYQGEAVAQSPAGVLVSLADKFDTLLAVFAREDLKPPTGSSDPMGLRRAALGWLLTVLAHPEALSAINWWQLGQAHYARYGGFAQRSADDALTLLDAFLYQRLRVWVQETGIGPEWLEAVVQEGSLLASPLGIWQRVTYLAQLQVAQPDAWEALAVPGNRIRRILGEVTSTDTPLTPGKFVDPAEASLWEAMQPLLKTMATEPVAVVTGLTPLAPVIHAFFDAVLVNDPDTTVAANRRQLLALLDERYRQLADFSKLEAVTSPAATEQAVTSKEHA